MWGWSTPTPTTRLDVNGNARVRGLGEGAVYSDANGNLTNTPIGPQIVAAGKVAPSGTEYKIRGASVSKAAVGSYNVVFTNPRPTSNYIIQLTLLNCEPCGTDDSLNIYYSNQREAGFRVSIGSNDNGGTVKTPTDSEFMFTVIDF